MNNTSFLDDYIGMLKAQLREKDRQLAEKDKIIENLIERNNNLQNSLFTLAQRKAEVETRYIYEKGGRC